MQKKAPETTQPVPVEVDFGAYRVGDPEEFGRNMLKLMEEGSKLLSDLLGRSNGNGGPYSMASETSEAIKLFSEVAQHWLTDPGKVTATQSALLRDYLQNPEPERPLSFRPGRVAPRSDSARARRAAR